MKVEADFVGQVRVTIQNSCYGRGEYYPEDDWSIVGFGDTLDDAVENAIRLADIDKLMDLSVTEIDADSFKVVMLDGFRYVPIVDVEKQKVDIPKGYDVSAKVKAHPRYVERRAFLDKRWAAEKEAARLEKERADRKTWERLNEQFGNAEAKK